MQVSKSVYEIVDFCDHIEPLEHYSAEQISTLRHKGDTITQAMKRLEEFDHTKDRTPASYAFYMGVQKREPDKYQDGAPVEDQEHSFFHAINEGLVHSILNK